ncbi:MAG: iron-dependent repressor [Crocinitomicaceae bacterium]|jgi:DtxR family Mn-dependent transcriptional regulator|nr:iron-dependent repressor [Crocinitomicaceae bacterium]
MLSITEENYIKHILGHLLENGFQGGVGTNELASSLEVKPSSVNVMLKRLREKELISYEKYGKIFLTEEGRKVGMEIIRKHRLWETFLYEKLDFTWDEVHEVAEQLEHIQSRKLVEKLDKFLGFPAFDPHGDPIPNSKGEIKIEPKLLLSEIETGKKCKMVAVNDNSAAFLKYVQELGLAINHEIMVISRLDFDDSLEISIQGKASRVSKKFAQNIYVVSDKNQ